MFKSLLELNFNIDEIVTFKVNKYAASSNKSFNSIIIQTYLPCCSVFFVVPMKL